MKGCSEFREDNETNDPNDSDYNDSYASCDEDMTWMNISFPTDEQEEDDDVQDDDNDGEETTPANDDFYLYYLCVDETIMKVRVQVIIVEREPFILALRLFKGRKRVLFKRNSVCFSVQAAKYPISIIARCCCCNYWIHFTFYVC
jgi:hypothetical protein